VEIITGKKDNPNRDWLSFVRTAGARIKIKNWHRRQKEEQKEEAAPPVLETEEKAIKPLLVPRPHVRARTAVKVSGMENIMIKFSKCCFPIPGEEIIGFITQGRGVGIHRRSCRNITQPGIAAEKLIKVEWNPESNQLFPVEIEVEAFDRVGVFKDILAQISETGTNVSAARVTTKRGSSAFLRLIVDVTNLGRLQTVIQAIRRVADVYNVLRQ
jgi:GTP pyrophosphokinase